MLCGHGMVLYELLSLCEGVQVAGNTEILCDFGYQHDLLATDCHNEKKSTVTLKTFDILAGTLLVTGKPC